MASKRASMTRPVSQVDKDNVPLSPANSAESTESSGFGSLSIEEDQLRSTVIAPEEAPKEVAHSPPVAIAETAFRNSEEGSRDEVGPNTPDQWSYSFSECCVMVLWCIHSISCIHRAQHWRDSLVSAVLGHDCEAFLQLPALLWSPGLPTAPPSPLCCIGSHRCYCYTYQSR